MKKILFGAMMLASMSAFAQETYTNAEVVNEDLNGTARYVGMGGAMEALGADLSTISTNPAGIGMFRRSAFSATAGFVSQADAPKNQYGDATNASLDQIGFVWSTRMGSNSYLNYGFSYRKDRNYNQLTRVESALKDASQNANSYMSLMDAEYLDDETVSMLDMLYYKTLVGDKDGNLYYNTASGYLLERATTGYNASYDFNISGNVSSRCYLGLTLGVNDIHYKSWTAYSENLLNGNDQPIGNITVNDYREITGYGYNLKFGTIFFPVEDSPLRVGLSVETPTWYELNSYSSTSLDNHANTGGTPYSPNYVPEDDYDYKVYTPWKFGVSLGHTISNYIALGASYQYVDYSYTKNRIIEGYDYYGESYSSNDHNMNNHTDMTLKAVSTLKLGMEVKPTDSWAVRLGYNYVSPMYRDGSFRDLTVWSPGTKYSSQTDYTNWKATNRLTCGFGYSKKNFAFDVAYQFSTTNGEFHPFMDSYADYEFDDGDVIRVDNYADAVDVTKSRHQIIATMTFKF